MYLIGMEFELITDHKALQFIFNYPSSMPVPRIEHWALRLQSFKFCVVYRTGARNIADPLSRMVSRVIESPLVATVVGESSAESTARESVPKAMTWTESVAQSRQCEEIRVVLEAVRKNDFGSCTTSYKSVSTELWDVQGVLLRGSRIVMPGSLRDKVIQLVHERHQGIVKTKQRLRTKVWWPGIDSQAEKQCRECIDCMMVSNPDPPQPIMGTKFPDKPWSYLSTDILGPLPDGRSIIVLVDYYSQYFECEFLGSEKSKSEKVIEFLDTVVARFGYCEILRTDNGQQFIASEFQDHLQSCNIKWMPTTPLWPPANGEVERVNRMILKALKIGHGRGEEKGKAFRRSLWHTGLPHKAALA